MIFGKKYYNYLKIKKLDLADTYNLIAKPSDSKRDEGQGELLYKNARFPTSREH